MDVDHPALDTTIETLVGDLRLRGLERPDVLFLLGTGTELLADHLIHGQELDLGELERMPAPWSHVLLHAGRLGELSVWALDDVHGDPVQPAGPGSYGAIGRPAWVDGLPVWMAAAAGAVACVHTTAGSALEPEGSDGAPVGGFAVLRDHINLSGHNPLVGLGVSRLGPLFPDQSHLHHAGLRCAALQRAAELGHGALEAIAACTRGPALETPAERRMFARLGADVSVQSLAAPLIACSHAGLACLALVSVTDDGEDPTDLARLVDEATRAAPRLNELLLALVPDLAQAVETLREGVSL